MSESKTYYDLLGVSASADLPSIRRAFYALSKTLHPDTTSLPTEEAAIRFQKVCEAYELLSDPVLREAYDKRVLSYMQNNEKGFPLSLGIGTYPYSSTTKQEEVRRPFSGGELFSLLLLVSAILLSLILAIGFSLVNGRDLQVIPTWLNADPNFGISFVFTDLNVDITT